MSVLPHSRPDDFRMRKPTTDSCDRLVAEEMPLAECELRSRLTFGEDSTA